MSPLARIVDPFDLLAPVARAAQRTAVAAAEAAVHRLLALTQRALAGETAAEALELVVRSPATRRAVGAALDGPIPELLESEAMERLVTQLLDSRLADESVARVLADENLWLVVDAIARSPAVTEAIAHQGAGFADQVAGQVGERTRHADDRLESTFRRLMHRHPRPDVGPGLGSGLLAPPQAP
jgi:hypothetical protein